jgi:DNA repair protein RadC
MEKQRTTETRRRLRRRTREDLALLFLRPRRRLLKTTMVFNGSGELDGGGEN